MRVKMAGRIELRSIYVFFCLLFIFILSGCGSSGSPGDPDVDLNHLHFSVKLINEATGSETDAISEGNPGILQITVTYDNDKNKPAPGKLVTATPTKGSFSVAADGTDSTDANGVAEIKLVAVNADGESVTGAGEISVQSGEYVIETPFAFQIGVPDSTRLGAFIDGFFQGGVLSSSLVPGENLSYGGTALIVADLVDGDGSPFDQPVTVQFSSQCGATLTESVLSENGRAVCVYTSNGCSSAQDVVTATVLKGGTDLTAMVAVPLAEEATGSIEFVSVQPSNIAVAGTATASKPENALVTFKVKDDKGHAMARELIFFSLTTTTGGITVSPLSRESDENGEVTALVKSGTVATSVRVKATSKETSISTLSGNISIEETPLSESIGSISLSSGSLIIPADGQSQVTVRATVLDKSGDPMPAVDVNFSTTLGTLSESTAWTRSDGIAEIQLQSTSSGTAVITANAHGFLTNLSIGFTPGASRNLSLQPAVTNDGTIQAGDSIDFNATLRDSRGNPVSNQQINFTFPDNGNTSGASLSVSTAITNSSGIALVNYTAGADPGVDVLKATLDSNPSISNTARMAVIEKTVTVGSMTINADPEVIKADGSSSSAISVNIKDISGAPVPAGTEVTFSTTLGLFSNGGTTLTVETTDNTGNITVSLISALVTGDAKVTAVAGGVSQSVTVAFAITIEPVVGTIALTANPTVIPADGTSSTTINVVIKDTTGTAMPQGQTVVFTTTLGTFADGSNRYELSTGDDNGTIITSLNAGTVPGFAVVTASAGGISQSVVVTLASTDASAVGNILIDADPTEIFANGGSSSRLSITINDTAGNPVLAGHPVYVATDLGTFSNGARSIELATTDDSGQLITSLNAGVSPGFALVTVTSGGISQSVVVTISDVNAPAVGSVSLTADPTAIPADGASSTTITAVALDVGGTPVPQGTPVRFATDTLGILDSENLDGDGNARTLVLETVDDTGTLSVSLIAGNTAGFTRVTATVGGVSQVVVVTLTDIGAPDVGSVALSADPTTLPADGASSTTITATALDVGGNPVPQGTLFYFSTDLGTFFPDNRDQDNDPQTQTLATIDDSGTLIVSLIAGTTSGDAHVTALVGGVSQLLNVSIGNDAVVGAITLSATPTAIPADGASSSAVTARISDTSGNLMPKGTSVIFTTSLGAFSNGGTTQTIETTDDSGSVTVSLIASAVAGFAEVTATSGGVTQRIIVTFEAADAPAVVGAITLSATPTAIPADGFSSSAVTARISDTSGNLMPKDTPVIFTTTHGAFSNGDTTQTMETTDDSGSVTVSLIASAVAGFAEVTATSGGVTQRIIVTFEAADAPAVVGAITLSATPTAIPADGFSSSAVTARISDTSGNLMPKGTPVIFTTTRGAFSNGDTTQTLETTDASGSVTVSLIASAVAGFAEVTATSGGVTQRIIVTFEGADAPAVGTMTLTATPTAIPADGTSSSAITVQISDTSGSPIPKGTSVIFTTSHGAFSNGDTTQTLETTDASGTLKVSLIAGTSPGIASVSAVSGGVSQTIDVSFIGGGLVVGRVEMRIVQTILSADGSSQSQVIATVKTVENQAVPDADVVFTTTGGLITSPHTTDENGQAIAMITSDRWNRQGAGKVVVTGTSQGISASATMAFTGVSIDMEAQPLSLLPYLVTDAPTDHPLSKISMIFTDAAGTPIADEVISVTTDRGIFTDSVANPLSNNEQVTTSAAGEAEIYLKSEDSGTANITATARNATAETSVVFLAYVLRFVDGDGLSDVITLSETQPLKFELLENGIAKSGQIVNFSTTLGILSPYQATTNSAGEVNTLLTPGTQSGIAVVDATTTIDFLEPQEDVVLTAQTKVVILAEDADKIVLSKDPGVIDVNTGVSTIRAAVYDENDNPVPSQNIYFRIVNGPGGGEYLSESVKVTNSMGVAEINFYAGALTSDMVEIESSLEPNFTGPGNLIYLTIAGPVANISVSINLESVIQPDVEQGFLEVGVSALVTDINGNPVADGIPVLFSVESIAFDEDRDDDGIVHCWSADGETNRTGLCCEPTNACFPPEFGAVLGVDWFSDNVNQSTIEVEVEEDTDGNGILDPDEDLNGNGILDTALLLIGTLDMAATEDLNGNNILDVGEDKNGNGVIDPIQGSSITSPILTENGVASTTLRYPMSYADNIKVRITAQAGDKSNYYETTLLCTKAMVTNGTCSGGY